MTKQEIINQAWSQVHKQICAQVWDKLVSQVLRHVGRTEYIHISDQIEKPINVNVCDQVCDKVKNNHIYIQSQL